MYILNFKNCIVAHIYIKNKIKKNTPKSLAKQNIIKLR